MTLWSGYEFNKAEAIPDPIIDTIPVWHPDANAKPVSETKTAAGTYYGYGKGSIMFSANGFAMFEGFGENTPITWMYYFDEFHWIWQGRCEVTYTLASTGNYVKKKMILEEGDIIVTPRGSVVEFKTLPGSDMKRICGMMPGYALHPRIYNMIKKAREEEAAKKAAVEAAKK